MNVGVDHFNLTGKRALVLAADTSGGRAVTRALAEAGADLAMGMSIHASSGEDPHKDIVRLGSKCIQFALDLSATQGVADAVRQGAAALGGLDILACCADVFHARPLSETTDEDLQAVMLTNFAIPFCAVRSAAVLMRQTGNGGRILLLTHVLGERGVPNTAAYGAAHAATQNLVRTLGRELGPDGITINAISLGWMDWMTDRIRPGDENADRAVRFTILKRAGRPEDVGPMAVWLTGNAAGYVTGQIFHLDGGLTQHI